MGQDWCEDLVSFHREVLGDSFSTTPHIPTDKYRLLREKLIVEETEELHMAMATEDLVGIADGIVDSIVVLIGTAVTYGIDLRPIWDEVQMTNMAKKGGPKRQDGKMLKPVGWAPPKVKELLLQQGADL